MNAQQCVSLSMLMLAGCASVPPSPVPPAPAVNVSVPVAMPCITELPKAPEKCAISADTHPEKLRCILVDKVRGDAYTQELEALLAACLK
jgi:hypothetical protein